MNLEQLKYIRAVVHHGTIAAASKELHISQSALSQAITNLEIELGVKIVDRTRTGTIPTAIGKEILDKAKDILQHVDELTAIAAHQQGQFHGKLHISTVAGAAMYLPKLVAVYKKRYPNLEIEILENSSEKIVEAIKNQTTDIGLIGLTKEGKEHVDEELQLTIVLKGKMVVAIHKEAPEAIFHELSPKQIRNKPLVIYNDDRMWEYINHFSDQFGPLNILFSTNNMDAIRNAVLENIAITIGPDYTIHHDPTVKSGEVIALPIKNDHLTYPGMAIVSHKDQQDRSIIRQLISDLISQLK